LSEAPIIVAFDIATKTGVCWGKPAGKPQLATWDMRLAGTRPARFSLFFDYCNEFFQNETVDQVWYESPMGLGAMHERGASEETVALLRGLCGVLELVAYRTGIKRIEPFAVQSARKHLTGTGTFRNTKSNPKAGKAAVMKVCQMLGVPVSDDNQADAFAGWSYACGLANPRIAHLVTPLFAGT
jgi:hypothetical protein